MRRVCGTKELNNRHIMDMQGEEEAENLLEDQREMDIHMKGAGITSEE